MNINKLFRYTLLGLCAAPLVANAQVELADKQAQKVTLGYEEEISEFLTTAATTTITAEELQRTSAISLADALYGKLLGLTATQNTGFKGEEGRGGSFNIRGIQTRAGSTENYQDANDILILVDGVERPIDRISVEEVESVTVLKDAAAVALFGHEGINGVLYVKTKRGQANSGNHVKAGYSHKFQYDPEFANMAGAFDYATALNRARQNDGLGLAYTDAELAKHSQSYIEAGLANQNLTAKYPVFQSWLADKNLGTSTTTAMGLAIPQTGYMLNGAYMRFKNITLGYRLPSRFTNLLHISSLRLYASADNLLEFSPLKKYFDPEAVTDNSNFGYVYPFNRQYTLGLNLIF